MGKNILTVIEMTDAHVKLIQAKQARHQVVVSACKIQAVRERTDAEIERILKEFIALCPVQPENLGVVIPRRLAILKQIRLPSVNEREIKKMIGLQLVSQIPYPVEDVVFDYMFLEKEASGYTRVLVIVVHKDVMDRYLKLFKAANIRAEKFILSSLGLLKWLGYQKGKQKSLQGQPSLLLNVDAAHCEVCFCHEDKLFFSRSLNGGSDNFGSDGIEELIKQVRLSWQNYRKEKMGPEITGGIILSARKESALLKESLEEALNLPFEAFTSLENILCRKNMNLAALNNQSGLSLAVEFGLLFSGLKGILNLAPREVSAGKEGRFQKAQWARFIILLGIAAVLGTAIVGMRFYRKSAYLKKIEDRIEAVKPRLKEARQKIQFVKFFDKEFKNRFIVVDIMRELNSLMPEGISFRSVRLNERGRFMVQGYSKTSAGVNDFQARLVKSSGFKNVSLAYATKRKIFNMEVTDFKIISQLFDENKGR